MVRRDFFTKLGALVGAAVVSNNVLASSEAKASSTLINNKDLTYSYTLKKVEFYRSLSKKDREDLVELRQSYRASGKLISVGHDLPRGESSDKNGVLVTKVFDCKESRDSYVNSFESIRNRKNTSYKG